MIPSKIRVFSVQEKFLRTVTAAMQWHLVLFVFLLDPGEVSSDLQVNWGVSLRLPSGKLKWT